MKRDVRLALVAAFPGSPPARGRGLKLLRLLRDRAVQPVAPRPGARIETRSAFCVRAWWGRVAPRPGGAD